MLIKSPCFSWVDQLLMVDISVTNDGLWIDIGRYWKKYMVERCSQMIQITYSNGDLASGNLTRDDGKSPCFSWVDQL